MCVYIYIYPLIMFIHLHIYPTFYTGDMIYIYTHPFKNGGKRHKNAFYKKTQCIKCM